MRGKNLIIFLISALLFSAAGMTLAADVGGDGAGGGVGGGGVFGGVGGEGAGGGVGGEGCPAGKTCLVNPLKAKTIADLFKSVMDAIFIIALPFFVLAMAYVGFLFVAARGNPEKLTKAKNAFLYAIIGTGVFFGAWVLINMLRSLMEVLTKAAG